MAVRIRLTRTGKRNAPRYRVVVLDRQTRRQGRSLEFLGYYDPTTEPAAVHIENDRALHWLQHGATPSETVLSLLKKTGVWASFEDWKESGQGK